MTLSQVIEKLEGLRTAHGGGVQFCIEDADTNWIFKVSEGCFEFVEDEKGKRVEVGATYGDEI